MESGEQIVVGVNKFTIEEPPAKGLLHIDASVAANQIKKLQEMKAARDNVLVRQRLDALFGGDLAAAVRALVSESGCGQSELEQAMKVLEEKHLEAEEYDLYDPYG